MGRLTMLSNVEMNIAEEANRASAPYFSASIAVTVPAGIAVIITVTFLTNGSKWTAVKKRYNIAGIAISRIKLK